ncbi:MAG TPA: polysaccharide deacetylase family protein [Thermodesulfobacteriota bacterium]|nr:polysaccharide deacetylase family protein [Thermodesulfobacteriota bacterium]
MDISFPKMCDEAMFRLRMLLRKRNVNKLIFLMYHSVIRTPLQVYSCFVEESSFRNQMIYLKRHFEVISLSEAVKRLESGKIHQPAAVITLDDGLQNNYDFAFPTLREAGLPATIFLTTGLVNTNDTIWYCRLNLALSETSRTSIVWDGSSFDLSEPGCRAYAASVIGARVKEFPHRKLLTEIRKIVLDLGCDPNTGVKVSSPFRMLSHKAIAEMTDSGLIEFGAHTHSHAILSLLSPEERYDEITRSVAAVHDLTGRPCEFFAYPNGRAQDYNTEVIKILEACGVRASLTAIEGYNDETTPVMELRRIGIGANMSMNKFKRKVHGFSWRRGLWHR